MANQTRKKVSGTPTKSTSWMGRGSTRGVGSVSERRRYRKKKTRAVPNTPAAAIMVVMMTKKWR